MRSTKPFVRIDEDIFQDSKIRQLIQAGGYEYFGIYIGILTVVRRYSSQAYRIPWEDLDSLASWDFHLSTEKLQEALDVCIDIGLIDASEDCFWSKRRSNDLADQANKMEAQRQAALKTNAKRRKVKEEPPQSMPFQA